MNNQPTILFLIVLSIIGINSCLTHKASIDVVPLIKDIRCAKPDSLKYVGYYLLSDGQSSIELLNLQPDNSFSFTTGTRLFVEKDSSNYYHGNYQIQNDSLFLFFSNSTGIENKYSPAIILCSGDGLYILFPKDVELLKKGLIKPNELTEVVKTSHSINGVNLLFKLRDY